MSDRRLCKCHGVWMYRNNSNGGWRCRVKVRDRQRGPDLVYYHSGGWVKRRRRDLAGQRAHIIERLSQLKQEAEDSC